MKTLICALILFVVAQSTWADDPAVIRVRAALALTQSPDGCGECRHDEEDARRDATRLRKPLAVIVGECKGAGAIVVDAGGIPVVVKSYDSSTVPRIVILEPRLDKHGHFWKCADIPAGNLSAVSEAVKKASPLPIETLPQPKPIPAIAPALEWYLLQPVTDPSDDPSESRKPQKSL